MATRVASLYAEIGADTKGFEQGAARVKGEMGALVPGIEKARMGIQNFASANAGLLIGLGAVAGAMKFAVDQATEAELVDAKLAAVIKSTGGAAGMTANELDKLAINLSRMSTYDDEAIKGSEALLLTFTKIGKEVFPEAQKAILNVSTLMDGDLKGATIMLGKALQDPIAGMGALHRVGIDLNDQQREQIKVFMESGNVMAAQKVILGEISTQFGGQAAAAALTLKGQMQQLTNEFGNFGEMVGEGTLPLIKIFVGDLKDMTEVVTNASGPIKELADVLGWLLVPQLKVYEATRTWREALFVSMGATDEQAMATQALTATTANHAQTINTSMLPALADEQAALRATWQEADNITAAIANIPAEKTSVIRLITDTSGMGSGIGPTGMHHLPPPGSTGSSGIGGSGMHVLPPPPTDFWSQPWNQFNGGDNGDTSLMSGGFAGLSPDAMNYLQLNHGPGSSPQTANVTTATATNDYQMLIQALRDERRSMVRDMAEALANAGVGR